MSNHFGQPSNKCPINLCEITKRIIEADVNQLAGVENSNAEAVYKRIVPYVDENRKQWFASKRADIHYEDPLCRLAYLYFGVPANANLIAHIFAHDTELSSYFADIQKGRGCVGICAFGGGPGTELLGLAKWIVKQNMISKTFVKYFVVDRVNEWSDSWTQLQTQVEAGLGIRFGDDRSTWPFLSQCHFIKMDVTDAAEVNKYSNWGSVFSQHQLYIMCYLISEIFTRQDLMPLGALTAKIAKQAPKGSKFLFVEREGDMWVERIEEIAKRASLKLSPVQRSQRRIDSDENPLVLRQMNSVLQDARAPRSDWKALWVVGTKQ